MTHERTGVSGFEFGRVGSGVPAALSQHIAKIFEALRAPVYRQVLRILGRPAEAEDIAQEVFLRLFDELRRGQSIENPRAWVFRASYNLAIDRYRAERNLGSLESADVAIEEIPDPSQQSEGSLLKREKTERMATLLAGLSPQERRCMELRTEGLRYREIAEVLGLRISTVETNLSRAVKKLMERVHE